MRDCRCFIRGSLLVFLLLFNGMTYCQMPGESSVIIGKQEWMTENLSVDHYRDGTPIPEAKTVAEWINYNEHKIGCFCNYDNEACYGKMYGKLYNWYAVKRGIAPHCWRLPTRLDYDRLLAFLGEKDAAKKLKANHSWNNEWGGSNSTGFSGFAAGCRNANGTFSYVGREGLWWVYEPRKTGNNKESGIVFIVSFDDKCSYDISQDFGFSVRCMRDVENYKPQPCP